MSQIRGHLEYLDATRLVFVGRQPDDADTYYVGFRNCDGVDTKLKLSTAAMEALMRLYRQLADDVERHEFPEGPSIWHWVVMTRAELET